MDKLRTLIVAVIALTAAAIGQTAELENKVPGAAELQAITARGRMIVEYDIASWHATDVVQDIKPEKGSFRYYIAKKIDTKWEVVFGKLNDTQDKFLIVYRAMQGTRPEFFTAKKLDPPEESTEFYLAAARAFNTALKDLGSVNRPYNDYAIPSENGQLYVYLLPAQTKDGVYPLGADVRYTFSADGKTMLEKRPMHKSVLEFTINKTTVAGSHTHVLSLSPEDSDVFYVLNRKPSIPEYVGTLDKKIYVIQADGTIGLGKLKQ